MTNFPMLIMRLVVLTNWVNFPGDFHREGGTNNIHQYQRVTTNLYAEEVTLCTNRVATIGVGAGTNGITRWVDATPPLPNHPTKE
jgi:hypothetical protein